MENTVPQTEAQSTWYYWVYLIIGIIIVVVIILVIVKNRNNVLNLIEQLPNYRIFYPKGNSYVGLKNLARSKVFPQDPLISYPIGTPFWLPYACVGVDKDSPLGIWKFDPLTSSFYTADLLPGQKKVKIINTVFFDETPGSGSNNLGFLTPTVGLAPPGNQFSFSPTQNLANGAVFLYNPVENTKNAFTLSVQNPTDVTKYSNIDVIDNLLHTNININIVADEFLLVPV